MNCSVTLVWLVVTAVDCLYRVHHQPLSHCVACSIHNRDRSLLLCFFWLSHKVKAPVVCVCVCVCEPPVWYCLWGNILSNMETFVGKKRVRNQLLPQKLSPGLRWAWVFLLNCVCRESKGRHKVSGLRSLGKPLHHQSVGAWPHLVGYIRHADACQVPKCNILAKPIDWKVPWLAPDLQF